MDETLILVTFEDPSHAYEGLANLKQLDAAGQVALRESAVLQRSDTGLLSIRDESDADLGAGTLGGGLIGILVGILGGPVGVLFGGAIGVLAGSLYDLDTSEDTDSVLEQIARNIPNGATALVAAGPFSPTAAIDGRMQALEGSVSRYRRDDVEAELAAADRAAREARRTARKELRHHRLEAVREAVHAKLDELRGRLRAAREKLVHH